LGLKDIFTFAKALAAKNTWSLVDGSGLWHKVIKEKYIPQISLLEWICSPNKSFEKNGTIIWKSIINSFHIIGDWLIWKVGNGSKVLIGKDPWIGCANSHILPEELVNFLNQRGYFYLN
jgi:hypothetical protein